MTDPSVLDDFDLDDPTTIIGWCYRGDLCRFAIGEHPDVAGQVQPLRVYPMLTHRSAESVTVR
jgi:hypothetical protein